MSDFSKLRANSQLLLLLAAVIISIVSLAANAETLRIINYNGLNLRGQQDMDRMDDFRVIMASAHPDIAVMQEIVTEQAVDYLLTFAFSPLNDDWAAAEFSDGPDTDNAFFYRTSKVTLVSQSIISTELRDVGVYVISFVDVDTAVTLRVYSNHLKASEGVENEERRRQECETLRQQLDLLPAGSLFVMCGDFNLYRATEPAYELLLSPNPNPNGQLFDPIDTPGNWHNDASFSNIHTQSPRTESFGGGATGGLDDRFDFILVSAGLMDTVGSYVISSSYHTFGNDGIHFNRAINELPNLAVPDSTANALHFASDHLPVVCDFEFRAAGTQSLTERPIPINYRVMRCYPNPFNSVLTISLDGLLTKSSLEIVDVLGRKVIERNLPAAPAAIQTQVDFSRCGTGVYWVRLKSGDAVNVQRVVYLR